MLKKVCCAYIIDQPHIFINCLNNSRCFHHESGEPDAIELRAICALNLQSLQLYHRYRLHQVRPQSGQQPDDDVTGYRRPKSSVTLNPGEYCIMSRFANFNSRLLLALIVIIFSNIAVFKSCIRVPPKATLMIWIPRQMPNIGYWHLEMNLLALYQESTKSGSA